MAKRKQIVVKRQRVWWGVVVGALIVGLADAVYLLIAHVQHKTGAGLGGLCDISAGVNCTAAIDSQFSTLAGIPVPVFAIGFYAGALVLAIRAGVGGARRPVAWDLLVVAFCGALAYTALLLYVMLFQLPALCPACLILDSAALVGLVASAVVSEKGLRGAFGRLRRGLLSALTGGDAVSFAVGFAAVFFVASWVAQTMLAETEREYTADEAYELVRNYPDRYDLSAFAGAPAEGPDDAVVTIVEISDFQCPYCARLRSVLERIREEHPDQVRLQFVHYPVSSICNSRITSPFHERACGAARAAVCAEEQGRFWELHDLLFDNQRHLDPETIADIAESLDLDMDDFHGCWADGASLERVTQDIEQAWRVGTEAGLEAVGTPLSFINGLMVTGSRPYGAMKALVEAEIRRADQGHAPASP